MHRNKKLQYNLKDPPKKDTFVVPNKGYVILRFQTDNHGSLNFIYLLFYLFNLVVIISFVILVRLLAVGGEKYWNFTCDFRTWYAIFNACWKS